MIIKVKPDKKKVSSILDLIKNREEFIKFLDVKKFSTIATESYYEIVKELSTALILLDGFKSIGENSHKDLIDFLSNYKEIEDKEIVLLNDLRVRRNKSSYEGKMIESSFLEFKQKDILGIINKLKIIIKNKL